MSQFISEVVEGGPGCTRGDCMILDGGGHTTAAYYPPIYNAKGQNINPNMNITFSNRMCKTCNRSWTEEWQNGSRLS